MTLSMVYQDLNSFSLDIIMGTSKNYIFHNKNNKKSNFCLKSAQGNPPNLIFRGSFMMQY